MTSLDKTPGRFKVALNLYFDEINQDVGGVPQADALIFVYRKSDNKRITSFFIDYVSRKPVVYTNQLCATQRQIKTTLYRYERVVNWDPFEYTDVEGYYMTWQYCCRNGDIDNIHTPALAGQTFYLEFPAIYPSGARLVFNSSPVFDQVDGEFICINEPFRFSFDARDADGDELRYSMVTPFDRLDPELGIGSANGLTIQWLPGYTPEQAIPGAPPLTINKQTGELHVTATKQGLYVFSVLVEEYRRGQRIGSVRRDYQLFVIDCPPTIPPDPTILVNNEPVTEIQVCDGKSIKLEATTNLNWDYQWKKDGKNITGATKSSLTVTESGTYQLTTSLKAQCSKTRRSRDVNVTVLTNRIKITSQNPPHICGTAGLVNLTVPAGSNLTYQWYKDSKLLSIQTNALAASQVGQYWAVVRDNNRGCLSISDTATITSVSLPEVALTPQRATTVICAGDSLALIATQRSTYQYQWLYNGLPVANATTNRISMRQAGQYAVTITDTTGCQTTKNYNLTVTAAVSVTFDSIPKQCGLSSASLITLKGNPAGGYFTGPGVSGDQFNPRQAGAGRHRLTYTLQSELACQNGQAQRLAVIGDPAVTIVPARAVTEICANDSLVLAAQTPTGSDPYQFMWLHNGQPSSGGVNLVARRAGQYQVNVTDSYGCDAQSLPFSLTVAPTIRVTMDSIPPLCGINHPVIILRGYPDGGVFRGPGVMGNKFDPRSAKVGSHVLQYNVSSPFTCQNGIASRIAVIRPLPAIELGADREIGRGSTTRLGISLKGTYQYSWAPPLGLTDSRSAEPEANPDETTSYTVTVQDEYGCTTTDSITVHVYERIWIPDAFTPNDDGLNDHWELRGIESYPKAEVTIFNRWGEVVFFSIGYQKPFNGQYLDTRLPAGVYAYQIKPTPSQRAYQGSVLLVR
ncbi:gliding motility-associated-like protein [Spirosoma lacussanchae]|uniref:gliding motility-associated C-terminal domain-containing protein n=1 Tax=Spirosoma lacussanchae TaxID=1884249 RepID=UPI003D1A241A